MANSIAYASVFQSALDDMIVQESTTAWMEENAEQVIYTGGKTVKIPKMTLTGLATMAVILAIKKDPPHWNMKPEK